MSDTADKQKVAALTSPTLKKLTLEEQRVRAEELFTIARFTAQQAKDARAALEHFQHHVCSHSGWKPHSQYAAISTKDPKKGPFLIGEYCTVCHKVAFHNRKTPRCYGCHKALKKEYGRQRCACGRVTDINSYFGD